MPVCTGLKTISQPLYLCKNWGAVIPIWQISSLFKLSYEHSGAVNQEPEKRLYSNLKIWLDCTWNKLLLLVVKLFNKPFNQVSGVESHQYAKFRACKSEDILRLFSYCESVTLLIWLMNELLNFIKSLHLVCWWPRNLRYMVLNLSEIIWSMIYQNRSCTNMQKADSEQRISRFSISDASEIETQLL